MFGKKFIMLILLLVISVFSSVSDLNIKTFAKAAIMIKNIAPDLSEDKIIIKTNVYHSPLKYKISKMNNPNRLIVDLYDTVFVDNKKNIVLKNKNIQNIKLSQFSTKPFITRLILTANSVESFKGVTFNKFPDSIVIKLKKQDQKATKSTHSINKSSNSPINKFKKQPTKTTNLVLTNHSIEIVKNISLSKPSNSTKIKFKKQPTKINLTAHSNKSSDSSVIKLKKTQAKTTKDTLLNKSSNFNKNNIAISLSKFSSTKVIDLKKQPNKANKNNIGLIPLSLKYKTNINKSKNTKTNSSITNLLPILKPEVKNIDIKNVHQSLKETLPAISIPFEKSNCFITYNNVDLINNHLTISGIGTVTVKEPFILRNPNRVVFDLPSSQINKSRISKTFRLPDGDIAKIGQFDENTVRVVIKTHSPQTYTTMLSSDLQSVIFTSKNNIRFSELPNNKISGEINNIKVLENENITKIILSSNQAIIHNIKRNGNLSLDLYNIGAPDNNLLSNLLTTSQFKGVNISKIDKYPLGSRWLFSIKKSTKYESRLSMDGKILEIILRDSPVVIPVRTTPGSKKVVIDPGHGGTEPGAMRAGIYEKNITLSIAKLVKKYLTAAGVEVIMTRYDDSTVSLRERSEISNKENPDAFVSIHVNSSSSPNAVGIETHYYKELGKPLAIEIQKNLGNRISSINRGIVKSMFYVIHHTEAPSVLVEVGFISNDTERSCLMDDEKQNSIAKAIADGILEYLRPKHLANMTKENTHGQI